MQIEGGMYDLPKADILADKFLHHHLAPTRQQTFSYIMTLEAYLMPHPVYLVVDNFGGKHVDHEHAEHLSNVLRENYEISED